MGGGGWGCMQHLKLHSSCQTESLNERLLWVICFEEHFFLQILFDIVRKIRKLNGMCFYLYQELNPLKIAGP